ncbi:heat shock 70 kDa protein 1-like [Paramacrobiotus metropolitanus]|uniref:heat shock 70 kDa protein 1-like n=1 Tax=Paramacrobiotus metropolitanus TaxID=2943436 RepID=UPI002445EABA|nr:heat shock 70 kDa protein 1-like [Paramacrobiotus metropolitanus]
MSTRKSPAIGIHLGTKCIRCAVYIKGQYIILHNPWGSDSVPFYYALNNDEQNDYLLGEDAQNFSFIAPDCCVFDLGKFVNELSAEKFVQQQRKYMLPFDVDRDKNGDIGVKLNRPNHDFPEFWPMHRILKRIFAMVKDFARYNTDVITQEITDVVFSVPPNWSYLQDEFIKHVAQLAGLNASTVSRNLACFIGWSTERRVVHGNYLTLNIGAAQTQISVFRIAHQRIHKLYESVPIEIGGEDFDCQMVRHCCFRFAQEYGIDLLRGHQNLSAIERLRFHCEKAKRELTAAKTTVIHIPNIVNSIDFAWKVTREDLESICSEEIAKVASYVDNEVNKIDLRDIYEVVPFGGTTRMPCIQQQIREIFRSSVINQAVRSYADAASLYGAANVAAAPEFYAYLNDRDNEKLFHRRTTYVSDVYEPEVVTDQKSKIPIVVTRVQNELIREVEPGNRLRPNWAATVQVDNGIGDFNDKTIKSVSDDKPLPPIRTVDVENVPPAPVVNERPRSLHNEEAQKVTQPPAAERQSSSVENKLPPREQLTERFSAEADIAYIEGDTEDNFRAMVKVFERNREAYKKERYLAFLDLKSRHEFFATRIEAGLIEGILVKRTFNVFHDKHALSRVQFNTGYEAKEFNFWTQHYKDIEHTEDEPMEADQRNGYPDGRNKQRRAANDNDLGGRSENGNGKPRTVKKTKPKSFLDTILACGRGNGDDD